MSNMADNAKRSRVKKEKREGKRRGHRRLCRWSGEE